MEGQTGKTFTTQVSPAVSFDVVFEQEEDGGYVVTCPSLPGCVSQGDTWDEALANIQEAIVGYMESLRKHGPRAAAGDDRSGWRAAIGKNTGNGCHCEEHLR